MTLLCLSRYSKYGNDHQMALLHQCGILMVSSPDSECVQRQRTLDCKKKTSTTPNRRERPLIRKTGRGATERETDGQKEKGRMQCFMKKEDNSLIDIIEHVKTTGERCCHLS